ncbi:M23 family metallopeptidase [Candidatus Oscillochloris fontis]|uniref:M23 family metallopeptidase n=1 Tax=Candidatus Oscillochloris fontis TaxID=2496868 RepID=UPI00101CD174|nr:M23 family metallopeptidase [Candidatus Oscillochloris fontis]
MNRTTAYRALPRVLVLMLMTLLLAPLSRWANLLSTTSVAAQPTSASLQAIADGFDFPVGDANGGGWGFWHGFEYYGAVAAGSYHAGEDWWRNSGSAYQPVYAIGNGVVRYASGSYPGNVVIIEHSLSNGETWYSMYGHVYADVSVGQSVSRRQKIATIHDQGGNSHLHFEIRNFYIRDEVNGSQSACGNHRNYPPGPGYWPLPRCNGNWSGRPADKGWVNPSQFINARRTLNTIAVGQGSSRQETFQRAYDATRQGTTSNLTYGTATNNAYIYNGLVRQDFSSGVSLIHDEGADNPIYSIPAYPIYGAIKSYWEANLWLGAPTTNQFRNSVGQQEQHFRAGLVLSGGALSNTWSNKWQTAQDCASRGLWRLEVINLLDLGNSPWPPNQNSSAGPSTVVCLSTSKSGYAFFYDVGAGPAAVAQGIEADHWMARLSGEISGIPSNLIFPARAACDDGCTIQITSANASWLTQRIVSWRDQAASSLNPLVGVRNGDRVNVTWYEHAGLARAWLKIGPTAMMVPPMAATCDASIAIADNAPMIRTPATTLTINAPGAAEMKVGHLADLSDAIWQPYAATIPLQLASSSSVITQTVYAQFRDSTAEPLCQGGMLSTDVVLDPLPPTGTVAIADNNAILVTLQLAASDQPDGSGIESVAIMPIEPGQPAIDPTTLPDVAWQAYSSSVSIPKPMSYDVTQGATTNLTYQVWFRDAVGNIAAPLTVTVPYVAPLAPTYNVYLPLIRR